MKNSSPSIINTLLALEWLILIGVAFGGQYLTSIVRGAEHFSEHSLRFARAGHAHGGVLTALGMIFILCLSRTDLSSRAALNAWLVWLIGALGVSGGLFLHAFRGEDGSGSIGTTVIAIGGAGLMVASLFLSWALWRSR